MVFYHAALVRRWFDEVWTQGREETIDELFTADGVGHGLGEGDHDVHGPAGFKVFWRNLRTAMPDMQISVEDTVVEGDKVAARLRLTGTHHGEGLGVPSTGRKVAVSGIVIIRVHDGKIAEAWNSWDQLGLLRQIGVVPGQPEDRFLAAKV